MACSEALHMVQGCINNAAVILDQSFYSFSLHRGTSYTFSASKAVDCACSNFQLKLMDDRVFASLACVLH